MTLESLYKPKKSDIPQMVEVLPEAFKHYPLWADIVIDINRRKKFMKKVFTINLKVALKYGQVYADSHEIHAVIIFLPTSEYDFTLRKIISSGALLDLRTLFRLLKPEEFQRFRNFLRALRNLHKDYELEHNMHLQRMAVKPEYQGRGLASKVALPVLEDLASKGMGCYLETGNRNNVKLYQKWGFKTLGTMISEHKYYYYMHRPVDEDLHQQEEKLTYSTKVI